MKTFSIKFTLLFLCLGWILSFGCTTTKPLSLDILIPPDTLIYPGLKSATIVYQNRLIEISDSLFMKKLDSLVADIAFRKKLFEECTQGFLDLLESSPGIDSVEIDSVASATLYPLLHDYDTLDKAFVSEVCLGTNTDVAFFLEGINAWDTLISSRIYHIFPETGSGQNVEYQNLALVLTSRWSVYDVFSQQLLDRYLYSDTVIWSSDIFEVLEDAIELPESENAYLEAFYWAGNGYGKRIVSTWEQTERFYYCTNNNLMKMACQKASNGNWREAAIIWKELTGHKNKSLAAKAAYNMALVCELEDRLELAQNWVINSFLLNKTRATQTYLDILNLRLFLKRRYQF